MDTLENTNSWWVESHPKSPKEHLMGEHILRYARPKNKYFIYKLNSTAYYCSKKEKWVAGIGNVCGDMLCCEIEENKVVQQYIQRIDLLTKKLNFVLENGISIKS